MSDTVPMPPVSMPVSIAAAIFGLGLIVVGGWLHRRDGDRHPWRVFALSLCWPLVLLAIGVGYLRAAFGRWRAGR